MSENSRPGLRLLYAAAAAALSGCVCEEWLWSWWRPRWGFRRRITAFCSSPGEPELGGSAAGVVGLGAPPPPPPAAAD